jgi:hypothetical protein
MPFGPGERPDRLTSHDAREMYVLLGGGAGICDQTTGEYHGLEKRLDHEMPAKFLHQNHGRQSPAAETTDFLRKWSGKKAEFRERTPDVAAEALFGSEDLAARIESVCVPQQALKAGSQQFLLFCQLDVHAKSPALKVPEPPWR